MRRFLINPVTIMIWVVSFALVCFGERLLIHESIEAWLTMIAPMAGRAKTVSAFPDLSYTYFLVMQPVALLLFSFAWMPRAKYLDYSSIVRRYGEMNVFMKVFSWLFLSLVGCLAVFMYLIVGTQEPPGMRIHSSKLALALFGPIASAGLAVFLFTAAVMILSKYYQYHNTKRV